MSTKSGSRNLWQRWWKRLVVAGGIAAVYLWDEIVFGVPVLAISAWIGPWPAFLILVPIYGLIDLGLGWLALRYYERRVQHRGQESWLARWLTKRAEQGAESAQKLQRRIARQASRLAVIGFFLFSAWQGGAIVTTLIFRYAGHRRYLTQIMIAAAIIYALTFVGQYTGISALLFD